MKRWGLLLALSTVVNTAIAGFFTTNTDSLRGFNGSDRAPFDAHYYRLNIRLDSLNKSLTGTVDMAFILLSNADSLRLDLHESLQVVEVNASQSHRYERRGRFIMLYFNTPLEKDSELEVSIRYRGKPVIAKRPPWNGGLIWNSDSLGRPFWGVACQGEGASLWWPCKDLPIDEPDSVDLIFSLPTGIPLVSNGSLKNYRLLPDGYHEFHYQVQSPINLYNITYYAGQLQEHKLAYQINPSDTLRFFALDYHAWGAKQLLREAANMMEGYEKLFGPFHGWKDGYKLVESPYWGMEHQSAIAYGNRFIHNAFGFDFILVHESGHEWFGNAVTASDRAHDWIQESFTTYGETLLLELQQGDSAILPYLESQRKRFELKQPLIGPEAVYFNQHDVDIYFKGAWMLHTLRMWWDDWAPGVTSAPVQSKFMNWLKAIQKQFRYKPVSSRDLLLLANQVSGKSNDVVWNSYLNKVELPVLQVRWKNKNQENVLQYRWKQPQSLPLSIRLNANQRIKPSTEWQTANLRNTSGRKQVETILRHWLLEVEEVRE